MTRRDNDMLHNRDTFHYHVPPMEHPFPEEVTWIRS